MGRERRRVYRVTPDAKDMLGVSIRGDEGEPVDAEILDVSIDGMGITLPPDCELVLDVEQETHLLLTSPKLEEPIELQAVIRSRVVLEDSGRQRYGLRFEPSGKLKTLLESELFRLFNQRGAYRVELDESASLHVGMQALAADSGKPLAGVNGTARLGDISATGMGILVDEDIDARFMNAELLELTFELPDGKDTLQLVAWVRNRRPVKDLVAYGLEFDAERTARFAKQQDDILDFVMRRQREALASRVR